MRPSVRLTFALAISACKPKDTDTDVVPDTDNDTDVAATLPVWLATGGGPPNFEEAFGVTDAGDGTLVAVGFVGDFAEFAGPDGVPVALQSSGGAGDMFVARFDAATGNAVSVFGIGGAGFDVGWDVSGTGDGGFYAIGHFTDDITVGPADDPVVVPVVGDMSAVLGAWDADNHRRFVVAIGDASGEFEMRVTATTDGGALFSTRGHEGTVVAPGTADEVFPQNAGGDDLLVGKVDSTGAVEWVRTYGGPGDEWFGNPIETEDGYLLSGEFTGTTNFGGLERTSESADGDGFVARFLWDGTGVWATTFTSSVGCDSRRNVLTDDGGVVVVGAFEADVTFDKGGPSETTFTELGEFLDGYIARLNVDDGSFEWSHHLGTVEMDWAEGLVALPGGGVAATGTADWEGAENDVVVDWSDDPIPVTFQSGWIARFDAIGEPLSFDVYHKNSVRSGVALADGDVVFSGSFMTDTVFGQGTANEQAPISHSGVWDPYVLRLHY